MIINTLWGEEETEETFVCIHCKEEKYISEMDVDKYHKVRFECKSCRKKNQKVVNNLKKQYSHLKPSLHDFCPICERTGKQILEEGTGQGQRSPWTLDHNHNTGKFRSYICQHCNNMLSGARDKLQTLINGQKYLEKHDNF